MSAFTRIHLRTYLANTSETVDKLTCKSILKKLQTLVDIEDVGGQVEIMKHFSTHPNVVTLKDSYKDNSVVHIAMELREGGQLFDHIVSTGHCIDI